MILILDFGSQTTHLIARRVRDLGIEAKIIPGDTPEDTPINKYPDRGKSVQGIILSSGPRSVYGKNAPLPDKYIYELGVPVLGICYGLQATAHLQLYQELSS